MKGALNEAGTDGFGTNDTVFHIDLNGDMQVLGDLTDLLTTAETDQLITEYIMSYSSYPSWFESNGTEAKDWETVTMVAETTGDYQIGFGVLNDDWQNPTTSLYIDNIVIA